MVRYWNYIKTFEEPDQLKYSKKNPTCLKNNFPSYSRFLFLLLTIGFIFSCKKESNEGKIQKDIPVQDSVQEPEEIPEPELIVTYRLDSLGTKVMVDSFETKYNEEQRKVLFALNRMDPSRLNPGTPMIFPDTLTADFNVYAPFPDKLEILDSIPKTVLINQRVQGFALYEYGYLVKWGPVSSGKKSTPTPNGLHYGNYKAKRKVSTVNPDWLLPYYFNFMNFEGVGVHQYELPGFPASHACVRLRMEDAQFIYDWATMWELDSKGRVVVKNGTPFMVFGEYNNEDPYPWRKLPLDPDFTELSPEEMNILKQYVQEYRQDEKNFVKEEESIEGKDLLVSK